MKELSLFSGAGGGLLGTKLLGWEHIGYVEFNEYCQKIIRARIDDGILDEAPIFTDVREFLQSGAAEQYRGVADVVSAGFPCQPFSVAGNQKGEDDPRNMWPATIDIIRTVRPRIAFLENVPGLLALPYIRRIFGDLAEAGFDAGWCVLGADDCGGPHRRKRLWIRAVRNTEHDGFSAESEFRGNEKTGDQWRQEEQEATREPQGADRPVDVSSLRGSEGGSELLPNASQQGPQGRENHSIPGEVGQKRKQQPKRQNKFSVWGDCPVEPAIRGVANGVAHRVDRLKALGNGQVSIVAATAYRLLDDS